MSKEVIMKCPDCGTIVRGKYGVFFNKEFTCSNSKCRKKINPQNDAYETVVCSHCGNTVIRDTRIGSDQNCPACGHSLMQYNVSDIELSCPSCHMNQRIKYNETVHTCPICNYTFDVTSLKATKEVTESSSATVVTVPVNNTDVIWKHPMTTFPFASHVVVPEGYSALILRDGVCSAPSGTGKYILSDTIRTMTEQLEYAMLEKNAQISVQIFFVRKNIDKQLKWTGAKQPVSYPNGELAGVLGFGGSIAVSICDAKRFAEFVGYDSVSVDRLLVSAADDGDNSKLYEKIRSVCFEVMENVLKSAVYNNGFTFAVLDQNKSFFKQQAQPEVDRQLAEVGLKTSLFSLDFVNFVEDEERKKEKTKREKEVESAELINRHIETLYEWESPVIPIHMKGDITLSAEVKYGGTIKFSIKDEVLFKQIPEVQHWIKDGADPQEIKKYTTDLVKHAAGKVLGDVLQQMINDTSVDIRDMTTYYRYMRENSEQALGIFFSDYGLVVKMFTMEEKSRKESAALMALGHAEEHKTVGNIQMDVHAYDQQQVVTKSAIDNRTIVDLDTHKVNTETAITRNNQTRAQNTIDNMYIQNNVANAKDDIDRQRKLKYEAQAREDAESLSAWQQSQKLKGIQYQSEISGATHNVKVQDIRQSKDEKQELHYLNHQEIENRARELRTKWEADSSLRYDELLHNVRMNDVKWDEQKNRTRGNVALKHEISQASAENDRIINSILRKIAESDLELSEKKAAYDRMLRNQDAEDNLRNMVDRSNAQIDINYRTDHLKNILTREEYDYVQELRDKEAARAESDKNAEFVRAMKIKERDSAYELELLKMEYERDRYKADMEHTLKTKDKEIEVLREKLGYNAHLNDNDVEKEAIRASADVNIKSAEYGYRTAHDNMVYATEQQKYQDQIELEQKYMDRLDNMLSQILAIEAAVKEYSFVNENASIHENADVQKVQAVASANSDVARAAMAQAGASRIDDTYAKITEMEDMMKKIKHNIKTLKTKVSGLNEEKEKQTPSGGIPQYTTNGRPNGENSGYAAQAGVNYGGGYTASQSANYGGGYTAPQGTNYGGGYTAQSGMGYGGYATQNGADYTGGYKSPYANSYTSRYAGAGLNGGMSNPGVQPGTVRCGHCGKIVPIGNPYCPGCGMHL